MSKAFTLTVQESGIADLKFDLPDEKVNKFSPAILKDLEEMIDQAAKDNRIKLLKLTSGKENVFIAGADLHSFEPAFKDNQLVSDLINKGHQVFNKLANLPFPTLAVIHGSCLGGGLECALSCTYRLVSDHPKTQLGLPETSLGIIPGWGGTQRLPRLTGLANGVEMILGGKIIPALKAWKIHLADAIVPWEFLESKTDAFVKEILKEGGEKKILSKRQQQPFTKKLLENNPLGRYLLFQQSKKAVLSKTKGRYPAPLIALDVIENSYTLPLNKGLQYEVDTFIRNVPKGFALAPALIRLFFTQEALKKETGAPKGTETRKIHSTAVIGAGTMGAALGWLFADKGFITRMKDISWDLVGKGMAMAKAQFTKGLKARKLTPTQFDRRLQLLDGTVDYTGFQHADLILEAATENLDLKRKIFAEVEAVAKREALIASNTSSLTIDAMAESLKYPDRFVGMHFFNPVAKLPLVEVVAGKHTSPEAVATAVEFCRKIGKTPIVVKDCPGFLVNRIFLLGANEAIRMLEEGVSIEAIDRALLHFGMPMEPFVLADEVGNDVALKVATQFEKAYGERMHPPQLLKLLNDKGLYGKKSNKGFYLYEGEKRTLNPEATALLDTIRKDKIELPEKEILHRFLFGMINEAARCLEEQIVAKAEYLDLALIMGIGFPPFQGGLLAYADRVGTKTIVETLNSYSKKYGMRFEPCKLLNKMADQNGQKFL